MNKTGGRTSGPQKEDHKFFAIVKRKLKESGLTQGAFSSYIGVSQPLLCQMLQGRRSVMFWNALRIAKKLNIDLNEL